ncbi:galactoside O-acetyltransferase [Schleiferilactobacillus harbinensis DSM 16991]|uniref:Acetyltransferase n=2 Tax=Schleiferilactobacillus harbinensis TaxID=304207 RepID=A0A0R1XIX6_9LACO|nr:galactoside O-acetyltransferase [Schleiferilactobacillus harbinensis DSM 16991]
MTQMSEQEKMHSGDLYLPNGDAIMQEQFKALDKLYDFNQTRPTEMARRAVLLHDMFAEIGDNCYIEPPLHANWAGYFAHFGHDVYANFNLTLVDDTRIDVGSHTMLGPNVTLATAGHPILPELREKAYQYNMPVKIGANCWLGAGVIVLPGVTIGDNSVIGADSVVTHDIPANVIAFGNPCQVHRPINQHDRDYYWRDKQIKWAEITPLSGRK